MTTCNECAGGGTICRNCQLPSDVCECDPLSAMICDCRICGGTGEVYEALHRMCAVTKQHTTPCGDCPWRRVAPEGWLGDLTSAQWLDCAHGETKMQCHAHSRMQCAGAAIYRANNHKVTRSSDRLRLPPDKAAVFANRGEFAEHHSRMVPTK